MRILLGIGVALLAALGVTLFVFIMVFLLAAGLS